MDIQQLEMIKCLECRLLAPPPVFNLPPPPPLSSEFNELLNQSNQQQQNNIVSSVYSKRGFKMSPSHQRRCLKYKTFLINRNLLPITIQQQRQTTKSYNEFNLNAFKSNNQILSSSSDKSSFINLTTNESLILFLICLSVFLIVSSIAIIVVMKLFKLRKQLKKSNIVIDHSNKKFSCLSASMSSSSSSSTTSTSSSTTNNNLKKSATDSPLILTPTLSFDKQHPHFPFSFMNGQPIMQSFGNNNHYDQNNQDPKVLINENLILYNQLFATAKLASQMKLNSNSSLMKTHQHIVDERKSADDSQYLQAISNKSNLIIINDSDLNINKHQQQQQQRNNKADDYAEINSQFYNYARNPNTIYNQYDACDPSRSSASTTSSSLSYCSTSIPTLSNDKLFILNNRNFILTTNDTVSGGH